MVVWLRASIILVAGNWELPASNDAKGFPISSQTGEESARNHYCTCQQEQTTDGWMALAASSKNGFALVPPLAASSVNQACPASLKGVVLT